MLQGLATSVLKGEGEAACTPDAPRATKPTEATIFFIVILSYSHPCGTFDRYNRRIFSQTARRCQLKLHVFDPIPRMPGPTISGPLAAKKCCKFAIPCEWRRFGPSR